VEFVRERRKNKRAICAEKIQTMNFKQNQVIQKRKIKSQLLAKRYQKTNPSNKKNQIHRMNSGPRPPKQDLVNQEQWKKKLPTHPPRLYSLPLSM